MELIRFVPGLLLGALKLDALAEAFRPAINRRNGTTLGFSKLDAGERLNAPAEDTFEGLRTE